MAKKKTAKKKKRKCIVVRMTPDEYRESIDALGLNQLAAAKFLGISPRQSRRLASGERSPEICVEIVLRLMVTYDISVDDVNRLIRRKDLKK
jgi:plasmid maintenance system antidote protein VapI